MNNNRIIVIDDEESILNDYMMILSPPQGDIMKQREKEALESELFGESSSPEQHFIPENYEVITALQGKDGFEKVRQFKEKETPFALAFIDIRMPPGWDGVQTAKMIRETDPDIEIVIVTAYSDRNRREMVDNVGMPEKLLYLKKPFDPEEIRQLALALTRKWNLEQKAIQHRKYLERLLDSVRRLKTLHISCIRDVLSAILNEVLYFVDARKGFIARMEQDKINMEIKSEGVSAAESDLLIKNISNTLFKVNNISWMDEVMIFPLRNGFESYFILVSDLQPPIPEEKIELLRLLLETSSEVIESVNKQERFLKNERIATIGQIAAGIVHEINNPLMVIVGMADLYKMEGEKLWRLFDSYTEVLREFKAALKEEVLGSGLRPEPEEQIGLELMEQIGKRFSEVQKRFNPFRIRQKMTEHHSVIRHGVEQIRVLMENIRSFSRDTERFEPKFQDISEALENTLMLAYNALKHGISVHKTWDAPLFAWCDINGLNQIFLNLILNAAQAMEGSGELWIGGKKIKGNVLISVKDSGPGISEESKDRIFEAFYTTKADGTGLGLSIVKGIIDKHNGRIWADSEPGRGTTFYVEIPEY